MKNRFSQQLARAAGFTLIEIMITVAIVGILSAIALPMYSDSLKRGRLTEAAGTLEVFRTQMEQYYQSNNGTYVGACVAGTDAPIPPADSFTYTCENITKDTYLLKATGGTKISGFTFTVNHLNERRTTATQTGWGTAPVTCWVTKKGGEC